MADNITQQNQQALTFLQGEQKQNMQVQDKNQQQQQQQQPQQIYQSVEIQSQNPQQQKYQQGVSQQKIQDNEQPFQRYNNQNDFQKMNYQMPDYNNQYQGRYDIGERDYQPSYNIMNQNNQMQGGPNPRQQQNQYNYYQFQDDYQPEQRLQQSFSRQKFGGNEYDQYKDFNRYNAQGGGYQQQYRKPSFQDNLNQPNYQKYSSSIRNDDNYRPYYYQQDVVGGGLQQFQSNPYRNLQKQGWGGGASMFDADPIFYSDSGFEKLFMTNNFYLQSKLLLKHDVFQQQQTGEVDTGINLELFPGQKTENKLNSRQPIFQIKENSGFCNKCIIQNCRPFYAQILHKGSRNENQPFLTLTRACTCTFLCCNRPEVVISYIDEFSKRALDLGFIINPYTCCGESVNVYNDQQKLVFKIKVDCCSGGLMCNNCCGQCKFVEFNIRDNTGQIVGKFVKSLSDCCSCGFSDNSETLDMEYFDIQLPNRASKEERALLLAAVVFLEFHYFDPKTISY